MLIPTIKDVRFVGRDLVVRFGAPKQCEVVAAVEKANVIDPNPAQGEIIDFIRAGVSGSISNGPRVEDSERPTLSVVEATSSIPYAPAGTHPCDIGLRKDGRASEDRNDANRMRQHEREKSPWVSDGCHNAELARHFNVVVQTVRRRVRSIFKERSLLVRLQILAHFHKDASQPVVLDPPRKDRHDRRLHRQQIGDGLRDTASTLDCESSHDEGDIS